jgi:hypothetical protein
MPVTVLEALASGIPEQDHGVAAEYLGVDPHPPGVIGNARRQGYLADHVGFQAGDLMLDKTLSVECAVEVRDNGFPAVRVVEAD